MFLDQARIEISSGKGGNGGKGGDIIFEIDRGMNTLFVYKHRYKFKAEDGAEGGKKRCTGKNGADLILKVPEGTILREETSGRIVADMSGSNSPR